MLGFVCNCTTQILAFLTRGQVQWQKAGRACLAVAGLGVLTEIRVPRLAPAPQSSPEMRRDSSLCGWLVHRNMARV